MMAGNDPRQNMRANPDRRRGGIGSVTPTSEAREARNMALENMQSPYFRVAALGLVLSLAACGGGPSPRLSTPSAGASVQVASGPISQACNRSGRDAANRALCGCVQAMANRHLSEADQRLSAGFYADPQRAQDVRQSDNRSNEAFWDRYKLYVEDARRYCSSVT